MKSYYINLFLLIVFPFIFLFPYTLQILDVGNDFELYFFTYKKYIFELLKNGHLPLWSPGEAAGYSLVYNPLTQFFYIPSWIHYLISFFIGDLSKYSFLLYTISAISIFNIGLFNFLKTFNLNTNIVLTTVLITCVSLKITELLRFPNALHTFCWFPWVLYGINLIQKKKYFIKSFLIIFFACLMIFTAGYPYYIFYGLILFSSYIFFLLIIKNKNHLYGSSQITFESSLFVIIKLSLPVIFALVLFVPIYLKTSELMSITRGRSLSDFNFSIIGSSNLYDQIGSWIFPPFAMAEGWYYFGATSTFIILTVVFSTILVKNKISQNNNCLKIVFYFFIFLFFLNYQFADAENSLIFKFIWNILDPVQSFRFWIRINIILVPIIALLLALSLQDLTRFINNSKSINIKMINLIISFLIVLILFIQYYFINYSDYFNSYWNVWQLKRIDAIQMEFPKILSYIIGLYKDYIYSLFFIIIFFILIIVLNNKNILFKLKKNNYLLYTVLLLTFSEIFFLANIQWAIPYNFYENGFKQLNLKKNYNSPNNEALNDLINAFYQERVSTEKSGVSVFQGNTYYRNNKRFNINYINHWGNNNHTIIFDKYFNNNGNFRSDLEQDSVSKVKYFFGMDNYKKKIFYSENISYHNIFDFINNSRYSEEKNKFKYNLIKYNGDELIIDVFVDKPGWVSFIDTWDPNWKVYVNGSNRDLEKLFDAYKSVYIKSGNSKIKFIYKPFNFN